MKNFIFKAIVMAVVALVAVLNASAQQVVNGINTSDFGACKTYLYAHPGDTLVSTHEIPNGTITRKVFARDGKIVAQNDTLIIEEKVVEREVVNQSVVKQIDTLSVESNFVRRLYDEQEKFDIKFLHSPEVADYRNFLEGDSCSYAGNIPVKGARKYGWAVRAHAGYSFADDVQGPLFGLGLIYDQSWWGVNVNGEVGKSRYSSFAEHAGDDYWVFRAESELMIQPFKFDRYNQNRLWFFGGIGFESFETGSPVGENGYLRSKGNYLYSTFGLDFEHRFFATGNSLGFRAQWRDTKAVVQNRDYENFGSIVLSAYFKFGFSRNKFDYKK